MNLDGGYTRQFRRLWDNPIFRSKQEAAVFSWMKDAAQWRETRYSTKFGPVMLGVGELLIAERVLADDFGLHRNTLRTLIQRMVDDGMIEVFKDRCPHRAGTVVRIVKYKKYQSSDVQSDDSQDRSGTESPTEEGPKKDRSGTKNKEDKESNKVKDSLQLDLGAALPAAARYSPEFEIFWDAYPRKVDKDRAAAKFKQACKSAPAAEILKGLKAYQFSPDAKFIAHPATWLHNKRWIPEPAGTRVGEDDANSWLGTP